MLYWNYKGLEVLLTDDEEIDLVRDLSGGRATDLVGYDTSLETRKRYVRKIQAYLRHLAVNNFDEFRKRYYFRSLRRKEAAAWFPKMLDAYGRATKLATIGKYGSDKLKDDLPEAAIHHGAGEIYWVTIFQRHLFPRKIPKVVAQFSFPVSTIQKLVGTVDNFVLITKAFSARFGRDRVRLSIADNRVRGKIEV